MFDQPSATSPPSMTLRCHPFNHSNDCRRLGSVRCASTPAIGHYPGRLVYGCQFSCFSRIPHLTSPTFCHGSQKTYPPHARPSAYAALCWTVFPRDASSVGFVERVSRRMSCPSSRRPPVSTFLFSFFILPVWKPPPPRCKVPPSYQAPPNLSPRG
jgi:hypothetical protein